MSGQLDFQLQFLRLPGQLIKKNVQMPFLSIENDTLIGIAFVFSDLRSLMVGSSNLSASSLCRDTLDNCLFYETRLLKTSFWGSSIRHGGFTRSSLVYAHFGATDLDSAHFWLSDLSNAVFDSANLTNAKILDCILTSATFNRADLRGVVFQPRTLPEAKDIASARNLRYMTYSDDPLPLVSLKNKLKDTGFLVQSKEINYALRRKSDSWIERWCFEKTCDYGLAPFRPLIWWGWLFLGCTLFYSGSCRFVQMGADKYSAEIRRKSKSNVIQGARTGWRHIGLSIILSLERSLRFGFKEFSPASALKLFLPPDFDIEVRGLARVVGGLQAVLSVGLIALSLLSFFTNFFDISRL
jgi:hypothetical protein